MSSSKEMVERVVYDAIKSQRDHYKEMYDLARAENDRFRIALQDAAKVLNDQRAKIEGALWPHSGFARVGTDG